MKRSLLLLLLAGLACESTQKRDEPASKAGKPSKEAAAADEVIIPGDDLEPIHTFLMETRRILAAEFIRVEMTAQFFEERMNLTRDVRYVERTNTTDKEGTRVIRLRNINTEQVTNVDPDLLPRATFGNGLELRAFREIRIYIRPARDREHPICLDIIGRSDTGSAKLWIAGRLDLEQPSIRIRSELLWSEDKEHYVAAQTIS